MAPRFAELLGRRATTLQRLLQRDVETAIEGSSEVTDFKDAAGESSQAVVDDAQATSAARELEQLGQALQRLRVRQYGSCLDCGNPIDLRRLLALPATPLCTACQALQEREDRASPP